MDEDESSRCLKLARNHFQNGNLPSAKRFCEKSIRIASSSSSSESGTIASANNLLREIESMEKEGAAGANGSARTSGTDSGRGNGGEGLRSRANGGPAPATSKAKEKEKEKEPEKREYTTEQVALVKRIRSRKPTEYYEILELQKTCSDGEIKKSYRKLALLTHSDKNAAPGADEAFKMVSKAYQVLSDAQKRAAFDRFGADPDSRGGGMSSAGPSFARGGGGGMGPMFADEVSPEDLFNAFFGGGMGGPFGGGINLGGPGFRTTFVGPGGARFTTFNQGGGMPRPRQAGAQQQGGGGGNQSSPTIWLQLLPLIFLFLFSLLTQLPSLLSPRAVPDPTFSFSPTNVYSLRMMTHASDIPYWVNPRQFSSHSLYESFLDANPTKRSPSASSAGANIDKTSPTYRESLLQSILQTIPGPESQEAVQERKKERVPTNFRNFERKVETAWQRYLQEICQADLRNREDRLMQAKGFFGIGADWELVKKITDERSPSCEKLKGLGYQIHY